MIPEGGSRFIRRRPLFLALFLSCVIAWSPLPAAWSPQSPLSDAERQLLGAISTSTIRDVTTTLASDEMQGRGTLQPGGEKRPVTSPNSSRAPV
jgi:hypothetical protein